MAYWETYPCCVMVRWWPGSTQAKDGIQAQCITVKLCVSALVSMKQEKTVQRIRVSIRVFKFNYPELYEILSFKYKVGFPSLGWEININQFGI